MCQIDKYGVSHYPDLDAFFAKPGFKLETVSYPAHTSQYTWHQQWSTYYAWYQTKQNQER